MMSRLLILFLLLVFSSSQSWTRSFSLDEVADRFPSEGFEDRIEFWKNVFAKYGERDILFHDRDDVRLVYEIVRLDQGLPDERAARQAQFRELRGHRERIERTLDQLARLGADSPQLEERHLRIVELLRSNGYQPTRDLFGQLRENIRYQRGIRERFRAGIIRSGRYMKHIEETLRRHDLPLELAMLPHVESSFDYSAYSRVGAAGIWQFMPATGREQQLTVGRSVDERLDPIRATEAAARFLAGNHRVLGNWPLAITAYNHGRNGMLRARNQHGPDLGVIIERYQSRLFGFAGRNFYAEFLAALEIARNYEEYFGPLPILPPLEFDRIPLDRAYSIDHLVRLEGLDEETLRAYNPQLTPHIWAQTRVFPSGLEMRVPAGGGETVSAALRTLPAAASPTPARASASQPVGPGQYRVQPGDSLNTIARRFGTDVRSLQRLNGLANPHRIFPGQVLTVSAPAERARAVAEAAPEIYRVRRGDNLASIAGRFGVSVRDLMALNNLNNPNRIYPGQELRIQAASDGPTRYLVQMGDNLAAIARRFGTTVEQLIEANGITNPNRIALGQVLLIP